LNRLNVTFERHSSTLNIAGAGGGTLVGQVGRRGRSLVYETRGFIKNALVTDLYDAESGILPGSFAETIK